MATTLLLSTMALAWCVTGHAQPTVTAQRTQRYVTLYQGEAAFVVDSYRAHLYSGLTTVLIPDLPPTIMSPSIAVQVSGGAVLWHRFRPALPLGEGTLGILRGHRVRFITPDGQQVIEGKLLDVSASYALVQTPAGLLLLPTPTQYRVLLEEETPVLTSPLVLQALIQSPREGEGALTLSYLAKQLHWQMLYSVHIPTEGSKMSLCSFALLENRSDVPYDSVRVSLVAGRLPQKYPVPDVIPLLRASPEGGPSPPTELAGLYRYDFPNPLVLGPREQLRIPLMACTEVPFRRLYTVHTYANWSGPLPVRQVLQFANTASSGLGQPLPAGSVQVTTGQESVTFIGETSMPETAVGDTVTLELGPAFDLTVRQLLQERRRLSEQLLEETYLLKLLNGGQRDVHIDILFRLQEGQNWRLVSTTYPARWHDATTLSFRVPVGARSESLLRFTLQSQYLQR